MPNDSAKRWILRKPTHEASLNTAEQLKLSPLLARILPCAVLPISSLRGVSYLSSSLRADLPSPFDMADMEPAVQRHCRRSRTSEQIGIWGDYDVDGTTGASVLVSFLREIGAAPIYHVPHRIEEGYGLNIEGLRRLKERGVDLGRHRGLRHFQCQRSCRRARFRSRYRRCRSSSAAGRASAGGGGDQSAPQGLRIS